MTDNDLKKLNDHIEAASNALEKVEEWRLTAQAELDAAKSRLEKVEEGEASP